MFDRAAILAFCYQTATKRFSAPREHGLLELRRRLFPGLREQMAVDVERDLDARMPHLVADVFRTLALSNEHRGKEVPKVVKAHTGQAGRLRDWRKDVLVEVVRIKKPLFGIREDVLGFLSTRLPPGREKLLHGFWESDSAHGFWGLRWSDHPFPFVNSVLRWPLGDRLVD